MEQIKKKVSAPKKNAGTGGVYDDMGSLIPDISETMEGIDNALEAAEQQRQEQERDRRAAQRCGC